jgi:CheY-like chemotaxis protein
VLVVDDEAAVRRIVEHILLRGGYRVVTADGVASAARAAASADGDVDLVLTDAVLPDGTGREVLLRVRQALPAARGIEMSAFSSAQLVKPFTAADLLAAVRGALDGGAAGPAAAPGEAGL